MFKNYIYYGLVKLQEIFFLYVKKKQNDYKKFGFILELGHVYIFKI